jgi:hypothetical protein
MRKIGGGVEMKKYIKVEIEVDDNNPDLCSPVCDEIFIDRNSNAPWASCGRFESKKTGKKTVIKYHSGAGRYWLYHKFYRCAACRKAEIE